MKAQLWIMLCLVNATGSSVLEPRHLKVIQGYAFQG